MSVMMRVCYRQAKRLYTAYRLRYNDFDPTFAAEKLLEEKGIAISVSVLRRVSYFFVRLHTFRFFRKIRAFFGAITLAYSLIPGAFR